MTLIVTAIVFIAALAGLALRANTRFCDEDRLPMQWWLTGEVTWSAPRRMALTLLPVLAFLVFTSLIILSFCMQPSPGQDGMVLPTVIGIGIVFLAIEAFHLWMIEKTLHRNAK
ncbi:hypothetical protein C8J44_1557 [Sphingomonas sp. PP-CE-3A-406]|uniref:hypothetical protein n=1 Tax=Sphingomonas sp. PP-CE-3A-406 TaxID=2135659 RepID=UPI000EF9F3AD|nr:hypothetical protein [Sphingomonas sp. PP-CE-3A-406]RMB53945.1 hypothetical protein C8J44_1557 [Sphingomonas sp. PP-CE-3A-406]